MASKYYVGRLSFGEGTRILLDDASSGAPAIEHFWLDVKTREYRIVVPVALALPFVEEKGFLGWLGKETKPKKSKKPILAEHAVDDHALHCPCRRCERF